DLLTGRNAWSTALASGAGRVEAGGLASSGADVVATVSFQGDASLGTKQLSSRGYWDFSLLTATQGAVTAGAQVGSAYSEHIELLEIASNGDALVGGYYEQGDLGTGE